MKAGMTNVDVAALAAELDRLLTGARIDKAYQPAKDSLVLRLRKKAVGRLDLICKLGQFVTITARPPDNPDAPSMLAKILRKEFGNGRVTGVRQIGFDRLLRMDIGRGDGDRAIVFELFGDGNVLLLDETDTIFLPMRGAEHGARRLKKGEPYVPPPGSSQPFGLDAEAFAARVRAAQRDTVRFIALDLGFGPQWAEELCLRAGIDKKTPAVELADHAASMDALRVAIDDLGQAIDRNDLAPALVFEEGDLVDAVPFPMLRSPAPRFQYEETPGFRQALDGFYLGVSGDEDDSDDPRRRRFDEAKGKLERQLAQMQSAIDGFVVDEEARRADGDALYQNFQTVEATLNGLLEARKTRSWQEIDAVLRAARAKGDPAAGIVTELRPHDATAILVVPGLDGIDRPIEVDIRLSVQENADALYQAAKKARSRREGADVALQEAKGRLDAIIAKGLDGFGAAPQKKAGPSRHFWFETYRWTITPGGFLVVGGRHAGQNDAVVKKYLRDGDRYVHAEIHGAPSVVVRPADGSIADEFPEPDLEAAGQFAVCSSRAWRQFGQGSAYWVTAQQVNKTPRSGEFVPRGAWIVHGKRNVMDRLAVEWTIAEVRFTKGGVPIRADEEVLESEAVVKLAGGPPSALAPFAVRTMSVQPGDVDPNDAAASVAEAFDVEIEEAQAVLPPGPVTLGSVEDRA